MAQKAGQKLQAADCLRVGKHTEMNAVTQRFYGYSLAYASLFLGLLKMAVYAQFAFSILFSLGPPAHGMVSTSEGWAFLLQ